MAHHHTAHPRSEIDERCARHQFEAAVDRCRQCGHGFCGECLVYSFGETAAPVLHPLRAVGLRGPLQRGRVPSMPKKEMRRRQKEADRAREVATQPVAAATEIDWSLPVNGSEPTRTRPSRSFDDREPDGAGAAEPTRASAGEGAGQPLRPQEEQGRPLLTDDRRRRHCRACESGSHE